MKIFSLKTLGLLVAVFVITFAGGALIGRYLDGDFGGASLEQRASRGKPINVLLMGVDARGLEENARSDTMIMASIDAKNKKVAMVWIPRDTRVEVSNGRYNKINSVNILDGPEAACESVSDLLGTRVDYYMVTNFEGFADIVDTLGGVDINVEGDMNHWDPDPRLSINLKGGVQRLDGQDALRYVRYRGGPTADIGRTGRQQKFVKALVAEMFKTKTIFKLPKLLPQISESVKTNIPMSDMMFMVKMAQDFDNVTIATQTLPGCAWTEPSSGASYWLANEQIADGIIDKMFLGEKFDVAQDPPKWVKEQGEVKTSTSDTVTEEGVDADAPMAEDATLDDDFGGGGDLTTGTGNSLGKPKDNSGTDDTVTGTGDSSDSEQDVPDDHTVPAEPVTPKNQNNKPVDPANNNPNGSPQPTDSMPVSPTSSAGY
ncbi:MAG: LytR family transcriptional regulator [Syntrophomonadaceae bacterium]|nr:LytR family transcriptional regulator [Syntrophomonadaceae bacterium]